MPDKRTLPLLFLLFLLLILLSCAASRSGNDEQSLLAAIDRLVVAPPVLAVNKLTETDELLAVDNTSQIAGAVDEVLTGLLGKTIPFVPLAAATGPVPDSLVAAAFTWFDADDKKGIAPLPRSLAKTISAQGRYGLLIRVSGISVSYRLTELVNLGKTEQAAGGKMEPPRKSRSIITLGIYDTRAHEYVYHIRNIKEDDPLLVNIVQHQLKSCLKPLLAAQGRPLPTP